MKARLGIVAAAAVVVLVGGGSVAVRAASPTKAQVCEAEKNKAAGKKAQCVAGEHAKAAKGGTANMATCDKNFSAAFAKAEQKAGAGACPTEGDTAAIEEMVDKCMADIESALAGTPPPPCTRFPVSGQTTCWDSAGTVVPCAGTGQDGDVRAGAALSYTDNGDGTITDNITELMWEKQSADGTIHDKDKDYTWANAFAVHIAGLNTPPCFALHCDWRLPNVKELLSIVNYDENPQHGSLAVSPAFNTGCAARCTVLTCSCTAAAIYWSSSTDAGYPGVAWGVTFSVGQVYGSGKSGAGRVRAVRGDL